MAFRVYETIPGPPLTTKSIGQESLIPAKYRRLVQTIQTMQVVPADTNPPGSLSGSQAKIVVQQESVNKATRIITEETIGESEDALVGQHTDGRLVIDDSFTVVVDGSGADTGGLVISSQVDPFGNGKSLKVTETLHALPANEVLPYWDYVSIPVLLFSITPFAYCNGTDKFTMVVNHVSKGGSSALRKHRKTVGYSTTKPNPNLSGSAFETRDIRYQGKFIQFAYNNVLNDYITYNSVNSTSSETGFCSWTEDFTFAASSPDATTFAEGHWYTRDYVVEPFGNAMFKWTHTEFYSASGNPAIT